MRTRKLALGLFVASCLIAAAWWGSRASRGERGARALDASTELREHEDAATAARSTLAAPSTHARAGADDSSAGASLAPATNLAILRARFVDEQGGPIEGVVADLGPSVWSGATLAEVRAVLSVRVTSDREGRVELGFAPPPDRALRLDVVARQRIDRVWDALRIAPGDTMDLGDVVLPLGATVTVRVVDARGKPIPRGWHVELEQRKRPDGSTARRSRGESDLANGVAQLSNVEPGRWTAVVRFGKSVMLPPQEIDLAAGETRTVEFVHSAYEPPDTITVALTASSDEIARGVNAISLLRPDGTPHPAVPGTSSRVFDGVGDGRYSVVIDDPRFVTWRKDGVEAGEAVRAKLVGSAAVTLSVLDARTGKPLERYGLDARLAESARGVASTRVRAWDDPPSRDGLHEGLLPVPQILVVSSPGYASAEVPLLDLGSGQTRALVVRLSEGATVRGVVRTRGTLEPVAAAEVSLLARDRSSGESVRAGQFKRTQTDADGRFAFVLVGDGAWIVEARSAVDVSARAPIDVVDATWDEDLALELPACAVVSGRVIGLEADEPGSFEVAIVPLALADGVDDARPLAERAVPLGSDGAFTSFPTPLGPARIVLLRRTSRPPARRSFPTELGGGTELARVDVVANASEHVIDARHHVPGSLEVELEVHGAPVGTLFVRAQSVEAPGLYARAVADEHRVAKLESVAPGSYRLAIGPADGAWRVVDPRVHVVPAGGKLHVRVDVALVERDVVVVDEHGAPLALAMLRVAHEDEIDSAANCSADSEGRVKLLLAPGRYVIGLHDRFRDAPATRTRLEWSTNGPASERVVLLR